ncbi:MAG: universal stress protein [Halodesulfurarchaeum sp.]
MYDELLLPYDGSDGAATALYHAAEIAHWADATIRLLFVADTTRHSVTTTETGVVDALVTKGERVLEDAEKTLDTLGLDARTDVVQGNPAPTISEYAGRFEYDVIVMPTHGREGVSRHILGSVTEKVVRLSSVPVLTVRMAPDEQLVFPYEHILLPTDGSDAAMHAVDHGLALAKSIDATAHVLSVVEENGLLSSVAGLEFDDEDESGAQTTVDEVAALASERGVSNVVRHVKRGDPTEAILDVVDAETIHAVVMGTTGRRGSDRIRLGSVAERTVRTAPVPVMTLAHDS